MKKNVKKFGEFNENLIPDSLHEESEALMIEILTKIKPFYQKYGLEETIFFLESILDGIHDIGDDYFE